MLYKSKLFWRAIRQSFNENVQFKQKVQSCGTFSGYLCLFILFFIVPYAFAFLYDYLACWLGSDFLYKTALNPHKRITVVDLCEATYDYAERSMFFGTLLLAIEAILMIMGMFVKIIIDGLRIYYKGRVLLLPLTNTESKTYHEAIELIKGFVAICIICGCIFMYLRYIGPLYDQLACAVGSDFLAKSNLRPHKSAVQLTLADLCAGDYVEYWSHNFGFALFAFLGLLLLAMLGPMIFAAIYYVIIPVVRSTWHDLKQYYHQTRQNYNNLVGKTV